MLTVAKPVRLHQHNRKVVLRLLVCDFSLFEHDSPGWPQSGLAAIWMLV